VSQITVQAEVEQLNHLDVCFGRDYRLGHQLCDAWVLFGFYEYCHGREEADDSFVLVEDILHATLDEHGNKHLIAGKYLQQINIAGQVLLTDLIVRYVRKVVDNSIPRKQMSSIRSGCIPLIL